MLGRTQVLEPDTDTCSVTSSWPLTSLSPGLCCPDMHDSSYLMRS